jgi:hypothetical protein
LYPTPPWLEEPTTKPIALTNAEMRSFLRRALTLVDAMAAERMSFQDHELPGDILLDFTDRVGSEKWEGALAS